MNRKQIPATAAIVLALGAAWTLGGVFGQSQPNVQVPKFQYDPTFPQPLPEMWAIGAIGGMAVDSHDHIWVLHRPAPLQKNERFAGAAMTPPSGVLHSGAAGPRVRPGRQAARIMGRLRRGL